MTQWDSQNKGALTSLTWPSFVLKVPLHHLRPSVIYSVPCDWILQRAYSSQNAAFFTKTEQTIAVDFSSPVSTVYAARNACGLIWERLVVLGCCLLAAVTKFQGKLASLQQVNSPNSQDNFHICCGDMYLVRLLANFAGFRGFTSNSRLRDRAKYQKPWISEILLPTLNFHANEGNSQETIY